jgi:hypothetical protein
VRGYLAALVEGKRSKTVIAWVWDVYDVDNHRALRIRGEEAASTAGHGTWAAADDQVLRRIAKSGMERLAAFLTAPTSEPNPPPAPDDRGSHVATIGEAPAPAAADAAALAFAPDRP